MSPTLASQHHKPALDIWGGLDGFCIGFVDGTTREVIATFPTFNEASAAYRAAKQAARVLTAAAEAK